MSTSLLKFQHSLGRTDLPSTIRHIGLVVATFADKVSGQNAYPSIRTIQQRSGRSRPTVIKALRRLHDDGWLQIEERQGRGRGWRHRRYSLDVPESWRGKGGLPRRKGHSLYKKNNLLLNQQTGDKSPGKATSRPGNPGTKGMEGSPKAHWQAVLEAIRRVGRYRVPDLPQTVLEAIRKIGGWGSICGSMEVDLRPGGPVYLKFAAALEG